MDLTPYAEDEFIREAVSHKLDRTIVNPSNKCWRDSTQPKNKTSPFHIGDSIRYKNDGHNDIMDLVGVNTNDTDIIK